MFPIRDDNPQFTTPLASYVLIGLNVLAWFVLQGAGAEAPLVASVCRYGLVPADLFASGAPQIDWICPEMSGWSGLFSSMFMHGSWMHLIGNMWFLFIFGGNVEDSMGPLRFTLFYLLCGLLAAAAQILADPLSPVPMVGASGAIGGVMGAYIMLYPRVKVHLLVILFVLITTFRVPAVAMLGYWFLVQVVSGVASIGAVGGGTAFWAHVGGFAAGAALIFVFKDQAMLDHHPYHGWRQRAESRSDRRNF